MLFKHFLHAIALVNYWAKKQTIATIIVQFTNTHSDIHLDCTFITSHI